MIGEKSYKNILVYDISYKTLIVEKSLCIRFEKVDVFIRIYDGTRYLVLSCGEKYDFIYNRIRYLIGVKSDITYDISHNDTKIKTDSYDSFPLNLVWNQDENHYYYNIFLEKCSLVVSNLRMENKGCRFKSGC